MTDPEIIVADITTLRVDAIVNAANERLEPGGGVCGAIHAAAGPDLARACRAIGACPVGEARLTDGFDLPARYVLHAVGPRWSGGDAGERDLLAACYRNSLALAAGARCGSIAFPCISTGLFGYPAPAAAEVALTTLRGWRAGHAAPERIICCCFAESDATLYRETLARLR